MEEKSEYYFENKVRMRAVECTGLGVRLPVVEAFSVEACSVEDLTLDSIAH